MSYAPPQARPMRAGAPRTSPSAAGWLALFVFGALTVLAVLGAIGAVAAFSRFTQDLPPVSSFDTVPLQVQSTVYDRTGKVVLAQFGGQKRQIVTFDQIPKIAIDAQTAVEDKTFWDNAGFDPLAIISAGLDSLRGNSRGASTITQQLVRQQLLDPALVQDPNRTFERKIKEIIQSIRLTEAFPGQEGKQKIIAAYLNQNYYGDQAYGIKAAAQAYFGLTDQTFSQMTPAQAAILAGLVKSPSNYDLVKNSTPDCSVTPADATDCPVKDQISVVLPDTPIVQRRNAILDLLAEGGRTPISGNEYTANDFEAAKNDQVVLAPQTTPNWVAPQFVWAVQAEVADKVCDGQPTCTKLEQGGLKITTTLDVRLQAIAEKWVKAAAIAPNSKSCDATAKALKIPGGCQPWMQNLRGKDVHNGALVATDYQTGQLVAYVGSADYYATKATKQFQPKFDVVGSGFRQPGSTFKPFNYLTAIEDKKLTAGSMLMDTSTDFGGGYTPSDADNLERGPVRVRNALQFSLNIPAVKAAEINGVDNLFRRAQDYGMVFQQAAPGGPSIALGVEEVRPVDLITAYGMLANGGNKLPHTTLLSIDDQTGQNVYTYQTPPADQVATPQATYVITNILEGNTTPSINPYWGKFEITGPGGKHRPATLKTGTNNDAKDLNAYGYIAAPTKDERANGQYALAAGAWAGNSDNSPVTTAANPVFSIDVTTYMWQGFMQEATAKWGIDAFHAPSGLDKATVDAFTGLKPNGNGPTVTDYFLPGTEPQNGVPTGTCGQDVLSMPGINEGQHANWLSADVDWINRADRGPGVAGGVNHSRTAYFYQPGFHPYGSSWGALVSGHGCGAPSPSVTCYPVPTADPSGIVPSFVVPSADPSANILFEPCASPSSLPSELPSASPSEEITPPPSQEVTPPPTPEVTPPPTPKPTPPPTPAPTPTEAPTPAPS